jgi:hypothetical protein
MPGLWNPIHNGDIPHNTLIENIPQLSGRTIQVVNCGSASYKAGFDLAGPWR